MEGVDSPVCGLHVVSPFGLTIAWVAYARSAPFGSEVHLLVDDRGPRPLHETGEWQNVTAGAAHIIIVDTTARGRNQAIDDACAHNNQLFADLDKLIRLAGRDCCNASTKRARVIANSSSRPRPWPWRTSAPNPDRDGPAARYAARPQAVDDLMAFQRERRHEAMSEVNRTNACC